MDVCEYNEWYELHESDYFAGKDCPYWQSHDLTNLQLAIVCAAMQAEIDALEESLEGAENDLMFYPWGCRDA